MWIVGNSVKPLVGPAVIVHLGVDEKVSPGDAPAEPGDDMWMEVRVILNVSSDFAAGL